MKTNFDINIPSIPGKMIKFKIQDIKTTVFGTQKNRFEQNKTFLTNKFVQSFHNFQHKQDKQEDNLQTQAESRSSQRISSEHDYRFLVPEEKKYLLHHYEKYKHYEAPILKQTKFNRGFSFYKTQDKLVQEISQQVDEKQRLFAVQTSQNKTFIDNTYFTQKREKEEVKQQIKHVKPTCVFKNQTRKRVYSKMEKTAAAIPGPGTYYHPRPSKPGKSLPKIQGKREMSLDYKQLKKVITNIVESQQERPDSQPKEDNKQQVKKNYMFIEDDRDRFGNQKYPIAAINNVPGPGAYQLKNSIEQNVHKIILVEEQRKLLKEWFNN